MAELVTLSATKREEFGKGAARRLRREGKLPAVVYGAGREVEHLVLDTHEVYLAIKGTKKTQLNLDIAGTVTLVQVQEVQVDPVRRVLEHIDFVVVK